MSTTNKKRIYIYDLCDKILHLILEYWLIDGNEIMIIYAINYFWILLQMSDLFFKLWLWLKLSYYLMIKSKYANIYDFILPKITFDLQIWESQLIEKKFIDQKLYK